MFEPSRSDARLLKRALSQGWEIPTEMRKRIVDVLCGIASDENATMRERTGAARALVQASRVELDAIRVAQLAVHDDLTGRVETLEGGEGVDGELATAAGGH